MLAHEYWKCKCDSYRSHTPPCNSFLGCLRETPDISIVTVQWPRGRAYDAPCWQVTWQHCNFSVQSFVNLMDKNDERYKQGTWLINWIMIVMLCICCVAHVHTELNVHLNTIIFIRFFGTSGQQLHVLVLLGHLQVVQMFTIWIKSYFKIFMKFWTFTCTWIGNTGLASISSNALTMFESLY